MNSMKGCCQTPVSTNTCFLIFFLACWPKTNKPLANTIDCRVIANSVEADDKTFKVTLIMVIYTCGKQD